LAASLLLALVGAGLAAAQAAAFEGVPPRNLSKAEFHGEAASPDARDLVQWVVASGDNFGLPFIVIDKLKAKTFVFDGRGKLQGAAPSLLGLGLGTKAWPVSGSAGWRR
jgi:hypothetical protein